MGELLGGALAFLSGPVGITLTGTLAALVVIVWDWRFTLGALFFIQATVGAAAVHLHQTPWQWILIQTAVMGLSCVILGMSASQSIRFSPSARQAGSLSFRFMAVLLFYSGWRLLGIELTLPGIDTGVAQLYGWLALCALLLMALGSSPLFGGAAFLLWIVPVQGFVATELQIPSLVALIGILELVVALACSYLLIAEQMPVRQQAAILTDVAFPARLERAQRYTGSGYSAGAIGSAVAAWISDRPGRIGAPSREDAGDPSAVGAKPTVPTSEGP